MSPSAREINSNGQAHHHQHHRPAPLKIHRDSHQISKQHNQSSSSTTTSSSNNSSTTSSNSTISSATTTAISSSGSHSLNVIRGGGNATHAPMQVQQPPQMQNQPMQQRQPVIIYTHSPKVIRTDARNFMALVQRLTGISRPPAADDAEEDNNSDIDGQPHPTTSLPPGSPEGVVINDGGVKPPISMDADSPPSAMSTNAVPIHVEPLAQVPPPALPAVAYLDAMGAPSPLPPPPPSMPFFSDIPLYTPNAAAGPSDFFCSPLSFYNTGSMSPIMDMRVFNDY